MVFCTQTVVYNKQLSVIVLQNIVKLRFIGYFDMSLKSFIPYLENWEMGNQKHTDDWHLAYMFLLVYFSVEVCLVGMFPHSVSTRRDPCIRVYAPLAPPLARKQNQTGVTRLSTCTKRGGIWTDMGLSALLGGNLDCWII